MQYDFRTLIPTQDTSGTKVVSWLTFLLDVQIENTFVLKTGKIQKIKTKSVEN